MLSPNDVPQFIPVHATNLQNLPIKTLARYFSFTARQQSLQQGLQQQEMSLGGNRRHCPTSLPASPKILSEIVYSALHVPRENKIHLHIIILLSKHMTP